MRRSIILPFIVVSIVACTGEPKDLEEETVPSDTVTTEDVVEETEVLNSFVIEPYSVGIFKIGEIVPALPNELKSRKAVMAVQEEGESFEFDQVVIFNSLEDLVDLRLEEHENINYEDRAITEMLVHSNYYETSKGIGVGSTIQEFMEAYPDYKIWYSYINDKYVMETPLLENIQFYLDGADYLKKPKSNSDMEILDQADFAGGSKIQAIRLF